MREKVLCSKDSPEARKCMESLWLRYYNKVLLEKGLITESTYRRMEREILNRPGCNTISR